MPRARTAGALLLVAAAARAQGTPDPYLEDAIRLFRATAYERCLRRLEQAARWDNTPAERVQVELVTGLCSASLGKDDEARDAFRLALELDPAAEPPADVSPKIASLFHQVAAKVRAELPLPHPDAGSDVPRVEAPAPVPALVPAPVLTPAQQPVVEHSGSSGGRWVALGLLGVGVAAGAAGVSWGLDARNQQQQANLPTNYQTDAVALGHQAHVSATSANVAYGVAAAGGVTAAIVWWLSRDVTSPPGPP